MHGFLVYLVTSLSTSHPLESIRPKKKKPYELNLLNICISLNVVKQKHSLIKRTFKITEKRGKENPYFTKLVCAVSTYQVCVRPCMYVLSLNS